MSKRQKSGTGMAPASPRLALETFPGHGIRRLQQIAVAVFSQGAQPHGVTPVQFAVLQLLEHMPGIDQRTLAQQVGFDKATIGGVIDRLEARGLIARSSSPTDRRVRLLAVTDAGRELLQAAEPAVLRAQRRMLDPLPEERRAQFMELMAFLIHENDEHARAPSELAGRAARGGDRRQRGA